MKTAAASFLTLLVWSDPVLQSHFCSPVRSRSRSGRFNHNSTSSAPAGCSIFPLILDQKHSYSAACGTHGNECCHRELLLALRLRS